MKAKDNLQTRSAYGPVRITIPAKVAYDLESLQKGIGALVDRLGCHPCFSGADCTFLHERDFIINEKMEVVSGPEPQPWRQPLELRPTAFTVTLGRAEAYDLDKVKDIVARVVGKLGHEGCHSGFDITFRHEWQQQLGHEFNARILGI